MSAGARVVQWVWHDRGPAAALTRTLLSPVSAAFGAVVSAKNAGYDRGRGVERTAISAVSVGNLSVGGTGKTPFAAWCARRLREGGASPAIVLRGYGDDEWRVHALLTPGIPVVVGADRVRAIAEAAGRGASVAVLDDAFQHRRAERVVDLVLMSADTWTGEVRVLPAGPWREPLSALQRASVVVITVKGDVDEQVTALTRAVAAAAPGVPIAEVHFKPDRLFEVRAGLEAIEGSSGNSGNSGNADSSGSAGGAGSSGSAGSPLSMLADRDVLAISAIANPAAFEHSLQRAGARVASRRFADHHAFSAADVAALSTAIAPDGIAVCTLKDAVKLAPLWPRTARPLWYLSQTIEVRQGEDVLLEALSRALPPHQSLSGEPRPTAG